MKYFLLNVEQIGTALTWNALQSKLISFITETPFKYAENPLNNHNTYQYFYTDVYTCSKHVIEGTKKRCFETESRKKKLLKKENIWNV